MITGSHYTLIDIGHLRCDTMSLEALDTAEPKTRDALAIGNVWLFFSFTCLVDCAIHGKKIKSNKYYG